ncbi:hypothetical protein D3C79_420600 [compost metagenome]
MVADVAHRIQRLAGRPCGEQQFDPRQQWLGSQLLAAALHQFEGIQHPARAHVAAGLAAGVRPPQQDATAGQGIEIGLGGGVAEHLLVHGGRQRDGCRGGQAEGGQQFIRHAGGQARHQVGAGGRDQHQIGPLCQLDVAHARLGGRVQQAVGDRVAGDGLQGQGSDELLGGAGHHHPHLGPLIFQAAYQLGTLVGGDPATDTQQDAFIGQSHLLLLFRLTLTGRLR